MKPMADDQSHIRSNEKSNATSAKLHLKEEWNIWKALIILLNLYMMIKISHSQWPPWPNNGGLLP
jgi:hypothetical protein